MGHLWQCWCHALEAPASFGSLWEQELIMNGQSYREINPVIWEVKSKMLQGMCARQNCRQLSLLHTSPEMFATYLLIWWYGFPDRVIPGSAASDILAVGSFSTLSMFACNEDKNVPMQIIDLKWYTNYGTCIYTQSGLKETPRNYPICLFLNFPNYICIIVLYSFLSFMRIIDMVFLTNAHWFSFWSTIFPKFNVTEA